MERFTEIEIQKILSLYRSYLQTNRLELTEEDKKFMLKNITLEEYHCAHSFSGIVGYRGWSLPILFVKGQDNALVDLPNVIPSEMSLNSYKIYKEVNEMIFASCLLAVWNGNVSDEMLLHAAIIDSGYSQEILPTSLGKLYNHSFYKYRSPSAVDKAAKLLLNLQLVAEEREKRKDEKHGEKHEDLPQ